METKRVSAALALKSDAAEGSVRAAFSVFDVVDSQGDVVVKSAFTDGQAVPMVWSHDWDKIVGKGVVRVTDTEAVFDGRFFTETQAGRDAYLTVKAMGELQEYSFGFQVLDAEPGVRDGQDVRVLTKLDVFEASPVLVGANRMTRTLAIKGHGLSFEEHLAQFRVGLHELLERVRSGSDQRVLDGKIGRPISEARRSRIASVASQLRVGADELDAMLLETAPLPKAAAPAGSAGPAHDPALAALAAQSRALLARYAGVT